MTNYQGRGLLRYPLNGDTSSKGLLYTAWLLFPVCKHLQGHCARALKCIQHPSLRKHGCVAIPQETLSKWISVNSIFVYFRDTQQSCLASPQAALEAGCHLQPHNEANCFHVEFAAFHASSQCLRGVTSGVTPRCAPPSLSAVDIAGFSQSMASPGLETFLKGLPR